MSEKKTIQIHPDLLFSSATTKKKKGGGGGGGNIGADKSIKIKSQKNKTTKSRLLRYIREKQEENYKKLFEEKIGGSMGKAEAELEHIISIAEDPMQENMKDGGGGNSDFDEAIDYLKNMEISEKEKKTNSILNRTIKNHLGGGTGNVVSGIQPTPLPQLNNIVSSISPVENVAMKLPAYSPPAYGCLKGGTLPTYRSYNQTQKNVGGGVIGSSNNSPAPMVVNTPISTYSAPVMASSAAATPPVPQPTVSGLTNISDDMKNHIDKLRQLSEKRQTMNIARQQMGGGLPKAKKPLKQKRTVKRTFYLGKSKVHPKVSVLVSNKTVRRNVNRKTSDLKQVSINEIRTKLIKGGFIKVGSSAPNDVLRKMYESITLIGGEVKNHNPENLLYNYFNGSEK